MKRLIWLTPFLLSAVWITVEGCRTVATPTFPTPPTNTPTITFTITNTPLAPTHTATNSPTSSPTNTPTNSPIPGAPTNTPTNSPTNSPTNTATNSPTNSPTNTITNTPGSPTSTPTICSPATVQNTYTFASSTDCWHADGGTTIVQSIALSTAQVYTGFTNSLAVSINNMSAVTQNAQIEVTYSSPQNMSSAVISMWIYADASLAIPSWGSGLQPFGQNPWTAQWTAINPPSTGLGTWINASVTLGSGATTITQFGLQFTNVAPGTMGNVYIDGVTITIPTAPTNTPTATPTPIQTWNFDDDTQDGWVTAGGNLGGLTTSLVTPGYGGAGYAFQLSGTFTAAGQSAGLSQSFASPYLNINGIRAKVWIDSSVNSGGYAPGGQIGAADSTGKATSWAYWANLTGNAWNQLDLVPTAADWTGVNKTIIKTITIQAVTNGGGSTWGTGNVQFDDIEVY